MTNSGGRNRLQGPGPPWARAGDPLRVEVEELPGCLASGRDLDELREALAEVVSACLSEPGKEVRVDPEVTG